MKIKYIPPVIILLLLIFNMFIVKQVSAQGVGENNLAKTDSLPSLLVENIKTHKRSFITVGQTIRYQISSSKNDNLEGDYGYSLYGQITGFTDSTISFQNNKTGNVTYKKEDLESFIISGMQGLGRMKLVNEFSPISLIIENKRTHKQKFFEVGQTVRYKLCLSYFQKGRITGITDSTISFQNKKSFDTTVMINNIAAFKVPGTGVREFAGCFLIFAGTIGRVIAVVWAADEYGASSGSTGNGAFFAIETILMIGSGTLLLVGDKLARSMIIKLDKSWISTEEINPTYSDSVVSLFAEDSTKHRCIFISLGQSIRYKTDSLKNFETGRVTDITDSTLSIQEFKEDKAAIIVKRPLPITILQKDLSSLIILSKDRHLAGIRRTAGVLLVLSSPIFLFIVPPLGIVEGVVGVFLLYGMKIDLRKSWTIRKTMVLN